MLVSFSVANFRSFGEEVTLTMVASNKLADHENHRVQIGDTGTFLLRAAVIYGANAAGKSNLVKAMEIAQRMIQKSSERRIPITPFRFQSDPNRPSSFEFRFLIDGRVFIYGFDIIFDRFTAEWLAVMKGDDEIVLFERNSEGAIEVSKEVKKQFPEDFQTHNTLALLRQLPLRNDQLFLNRAISLPEAAQGSTLSAIIKWFTSDLLVLPAEPRSVEILDRLYDDERFRVFCSTFLNNVGTGVGGFDFHLSEREMSDYDRRYLTEVTRQRLRRYAYGSSDTDIIPKPDDPGSVIVRRLLSEHHISPERYYLPFSEESDGTQALLRLMPILAADPGKSRVVVIDELDRSLHPLICWEFIRFFSESCVGAPRQLIVTTHEAHLLNQELLRRDEYWFAEKDEKQQTKLVSLLDFNIRRDLKVERGYLNGRFGAIPLIGGMGSLEALLECAELEDANATEKAPS